jgi:hypothetical protein
MVATFSWRKGADFNNVNIYIYTYILYNAWLFLNDVYHEEMGDEQVLKT